MKKLLLASAAMASFGSMAMADVTLSGYGRFGIVYDEGRDDVVIGTVDDDNNPNTPEVDVLASQNETQFRGRLRINIDASTESAGGIKFGARVRLQWSQGETAAHLNPALLYVSYGGLRVEVGNANTAYDSAALMYDSEMGFQDTSFGDPGGDFFAYNSGSYANGNQVGLFASYTVGNFTGRISYVDPDQRLDSDDTLDVPGEAETGISADYTFGDFTVSGAAVWNAGGNDGEDLYFVGVAYNLAAMDATIGLLYFDNDDSSTGDGETWTLYGNKKFGDFTAKAYIANNSADSNDNDTAYGLGLDYDLGNKTKISGSIQRGYDDNTVADVGVRFDF